MCVDTCIICTCRPASLHQQWDDDLPSVSLVWLFCSVTCQSTLAPCLLMAKAWPSSPFCSTHLAFKNRTRLTKLTHNNNDRLTVSWTHFGLKPWLAVYIFLPKTARWHFYSLDWANCFQTFLSFLSFQLGNISRIRKISFLHHADGGKGHNGELCNKRSGLRKERHIGSMVVDVHTSG